MNNQKKNILITGASSGIGKEISNFLKNDYNLFLSGRRKLELENYFSADLSDEKEVFALFNKAKDYFSSKIDILINCAGIYSYKAIENMTFLDVNSMLNLNFKAGYLLSSLCVPLMKKENWGRIVFIGSISGVVGEANATLYSATKSALSGLTKSLALEVAQNNITVNQINPGWVDTPLSDENLSQEEKQEIEDIVPQRRFIKPIEIATLTKYLISKEAKGLTGQNINLCAGLSCGC